VFAPSLATIVGPNLGAISARSILPEGHTAFYLIIVALGALMIAVAFLLNRMEKSKDMKWLWSGTGLAVLTAFIFLTSTTNRVLGASTTYPYVGSLIAGSTDNEYFKGIVSAGNWELIFLTGAFLSGLVL
jgi:hypothetical protein